MVAMADEPSESERLQRAIWSVLGLPERGVVRSVDGYAALAALTAVTGSIIGQLPEEARMPAWLAVARRIYEAQNYAERQIAAKAGVAK
jgi:hypothetical protein